MAKLKAYPPATAGGWVKPKRRFYYMACCDCNLVHKLEFKLIPYSSGKAILMRAWRDHEQTAALRKKSGKGKK